MSTLQNKSNEISWRDLYRLGGMAALAVVLTAMAEIAISFLPCGSTPAVTVVDWFNLFQINGFLALRNLGLLNIIMTLLGLPMTFALYAAHRRVNRPFATLTPPCSTSAASMRPPRRMPRGPR